MDDEREAGRHSPALLAVLERVIPRMPELGRRLVETYQRELVEYRVLSRQAIEDDVLPTAIRNVSDLLAGLRSGVPFSEAQLDEFRAAAARRLRQNFSMQSVLHAYRLWGQGVWKEIVASANPDDSAEREALLLVAQTVMEHVDRVSAVVTQSFLEESSGVWRDHNVLRRDLLEALIGGKPITERAQREAGPLVPDPESHHVVVILRWARASDVERNLRNALAAARHHLSRSGETLLAGLREDEVVAICPSPNKSDYEQIKSQSRAVAHELVDFVVGMGRRHRGLHGLALSYRDAKDAVGLGISLGLRGELVTFPDVLLEKIIRDTAHAHALIEETIGPLSAYDREHGSDLVKTFEAYFLSRYSLTDAARVLLVQPNTVAYRLRRIQALTGHDPSDPDGLLLLSLGLKHHHLVASPAIV